MIYLFSNRTYIPWPNDPHCDHFRTIFSREKPLPVIGLVSFPNSGNTWLRSLIEGTTGVFSGSVYIDECISYQGTTLTCNFISCLYAYYYYNIGLVFGKILFCFSCLGFFGEAVIHNSQLTSVVKYHGHFSSNKLYHKRGRLTQQDHVFAQINATRGNAILLIRNPYHVIYGYRNYQAGGHYGHAEIEDFEGEGISFFSRTLSCCLLLQKWVLFLDF